MGKKHYWFPAKTSGWGWGPPVAWQGRAFLLSWVALVIVAGPLLHHRGGVWLFLLFFVPMLALLLLVCWLKGEPPR
ncbi:MAG TPA: hypothetical protein PLN91_15095 [Rhodanobacteraceae bacterium]|nr:hypothetical protein [Rhodanobacteraceae bacterium]